MSFLSCYFSWPPFCLFKKLLRIMLAEASKTVRISAVLFISSLGFLVLQIKALAFSHFYLRCNLLEITWSSNFIKILMALQCFQKLSFFFYTDHKERYIFLKWFCYGYKPSCAHLLLELLVSKSRISVQRWSFLCWSTKSRNQKYLSLSFISIYLEVDKYFQGKLSFKYSTIFKRNIGMEI